MAEAVKRNSFISRFFDAIVDVISGIREVLSVMVFGPKILQSFYPEYKPDYNPAPASMRSEKDNKTPERARNEKAIDNFEHFKGNNGNLNKDTTYDKAINSQTDRTLDKSTNKFNDNNPDITNYDTPYSFGISVPSETVIAEGCMSLSEMSIEEFKNTLEVEVKQELKMHNASGFVEIGGKYFTYENDEDKDHDGVFEIEVKDNEKNISIAKFSYSLFTNEDNERMLNIKMDEFYNDNFNLLVSEINVLDVPHKENVESVEVLNDPDITDVKPETINAEPNIVDAEPDPVYDDSEVVVKPDFDVLDSAEMPCADEKTFSRSDAQNTVELGTAVIDESHENAAPVPDESVVIPLVEETPKLELADFIKLAEKGDFESFSQGTKDCSIEELSAIKDEIDILTYTASVGLIRSNFEKAMEIVEWQEEHIGETYDLVVEPYQNEPSYIEDNYIEEEYDYDDDDWR